MVNIFKRSFAKTGFEMHYVSAKRNLCRKHCEFDMKHNLPQ